KPRDSFTGTAQLQDRIPAGERLQLGKESFPSIPARGADLPLLTPPGSVRWVVEVNGDEIPRSPPILVWLQELTAPHQVIAVAGPVVVPVSSDGRLPFPTPEPDPFRAQFVAPAQNIGEQSHLAPMNSAKSLGLARANSAASA